MKLVDTHCHINDEKFNFDREKIMNDIKDKMEFVVEVGYDFESSIKSIKLSAGKNIFSVIGVHPTETENLDKGKLEKLLENLENKKVVALGEIGLDFHWETDKKLQYFFLEKQLDINKYYKKPIVFHVRDAYDEMYDFLKVNNFLIDNAVIHCFSGNREQAKKFLDMGFYLGFDGPITYKKNQELREVLKFAPKEKILPETDSPYLPPVPFRGKRNSPLMIEYVYQTISKEKNIQLNELKNILYTNAINFYNIK